MDPSHPGYPAWVASKYPEDILDEINGVVPPPRSRNVIVPAAPAPTIVAVPPAPAIDPALLALAPANHQTAPAQSNVQAAALPPPLPLPHAAPAFIAGPALIPPPAPANQALVLDQRTLEVLTVPNDGPNQAHALAAMQPNRRFQMKPGRTWRGHTHPSYSVYVPPYSFQNLGFLILNVLSFLAQSNPRINTEQFRLRIRRRRRPSGQPSLLPLRRQYWRVRSVCGRPWSSAQWAEVVEWCVCGVFLGWTCGEVLVYL